ncbi:MAG: hypothetical protein AAF800_05680 [Planctomycetota bacterium]
MACSILRTCRESIYRGTIEPLAVSAEVREAIGLSKLPNHSTLKKHANREGVVEVVHAVLTTLAERIDEADASFRKEATADATGLPATCACAHAESLRGKRQKR